MLTSQKLQPAAAILCLIALAGCTSGDASGAPAADGGAPTSPATPAAPAPEPILAMVQSGPYSRQADRRETVPADLVIWSDGLAATNTGERLRPDFRAVALDPTTFDRLRSLLEQPEVRSFSAASEAFGSCLDCPVTIVRLNLNGRYEEIAARGSVATSEYRITTRYPDWYTELRAILTAIEVLVANAETALSTTRPIPQIPIAGESGG